MITLSQKYIPGLNLVCNVEVKVLKGDENIFCHPCILNAALACYNIHKEKYDVDVM